MIESFFPPLPSSKGAWIGHSGVNDKGYQKGNGSRDPDLDFSMSTVVSPCVVDGFVLF